MKVPRPWLYLFGLAAMVALLLSIQQLSAPDNGVGTFDSTSLKSPTPSAPKQQTFVPFPTATSVKLFMNETAITIENGKIPQGSFPTGGATLTEAEMGVVRQAFKWSTPPEVLDACCIPRHAFAFYDKRNQYLGSISVCYECSCANVYGASPPVGMGWIEWDEAALAKVIVAHGLKTKL